MSDFNAVLENSEEAYVCVCDAPDMETGQIVRATLEAAGIPAVIQNRELGPASGLLPHLGISWSHAVYVPESRAGEAMALLDETSAEDELLAAEEADPMTLEEAEARVRDAK